VCVCLRSQLKLNRACDTHALNRGRRSQGVLEVAKRTTKFLAKLETKQEWINTLLEFKQAVTEAEKEFAKCLQLEHDSAYRECCVASTDGINYNYKQLMNTITCQSIGFMCCWCLIISAIHYMQIIAYGSCL
jgi:hypothetical protein